MVWVQPNGLRWTHFVSTFNRKCCYHLFLIQNQHCCSWMKGIQVRRFQTTWFFCYNGACVQTDDRSFQLSSEFRFVYRKNAHKARETEMQFGDFIREMSCSDYDMYFAPISQSAFNQGGTSSILLLKVCIEFCDHFSVESRPKRTIRLQFEINFE